MILIKVSSNFDGDSIHKKVVAAAEKQMRERIKKILTFPGSENLSVKIHFGSDGKGTISFVGDEALTKEALKCWNAQ